MFDGPDLDREGWRTFRVDRLGPKPRSGRSFKSRALPSEDVAAYVSQAVSTDAYRFHARVTVHAPARVVSERLSGGAGRIEALDADRCLVSRAPRAGRHREPAPPAGSSGSPMIESNPPATRTGARPLACFGC